MQGKDSIILIQSTDAALASAAPVIGHLTENGYSIENDILDETTKFGRIVAYGQNNESFDITAFADKADPGQRAVLEAIRQKKQVKIWEVDTTLNVGGKHDAIFGYGIVENVEKTAGEGFIEFSSTVQIIGQTQEGELDPLPPEVLEFAQYGFETPGEKTGEFPEQTPVGS